jgi:phosphoglycolate phosphatase
MRRGRFELPRSKRTTRPSTLRADSRSAIAGCINHSLRAHGLREHPETELHRFIGPPLSAAFAELTGRGADSRLVVSCVDSYRRQYAAVSVRETAVVPGIPRVLSELALRHRLAVATSKALTLAESLLAGLGLKSFFEVVCGPALDARGEDKSATLRRVLTTLGADHAVMIGDRSFDVIAAHACGIPAIGVTWGIGDVDELVAARADVVIKHPSELPSAADDLTARRMRHGHIPAS